jgi:hypothetical protein
MVARNVNRQLRAEVAAVSSEPDAGLTPAAVREAENGFPDPGFGQAVPEKM